MRIAIYGREFNNTVLPYVQEVFDALAYYNIDTLIYKKYYDFIQEKVKLNPDIKTFANHAELVNQTDVLVSLGGDGTLLDTLILASR
jgi:NAD+ kinase